VLAAWAFQHRLIYLPYGRAPAAGEVLPEAQDVTFETEDGVSLGGYWLPPSEGTAIVVFTYDSLNRLTALIQPDPDGDTVTYSGPTSAPTITQ
jgi:hypothetical protein